MKRPPLLLNRAWVSFWRAAVFRVPQILLYLANSRSTSEIKRYHRRAGRGMYLKNEPEKTCYLPFALNNFWVSRPYRRFVGNSITTREKASGLSWLEIDQVIQIPPWREAKRIGFKTGWERLRSDTACLLISFSLSEQKNKPCSRLSAALTQANAQEGL